MIPAKVWAGGLPGGTTFGRGFLGLPSLSPVLGHTTRFTGGPLFLQLQIWDTAGQERFRTITQSYYRSANGAILAYDITKRSSFLSVPHWIEDVRKYAGSNIVQLLIGELGGLVRVGPAGFLGTTDPVSLLISPFYFIIYLFC